MQENEFEKQVRKLMDDFQVSPSASVWEQVQARIMQRRRKWPLVLFLLLSMLGTGYLIYHQFHEKPSEIVQAKEKTTNPEDLQKKDESQGPQEHNAVKENNLQKNMVIKTENGTGKGSPQQSTASKNVHQQIVSTEEAGSPQMKQEYPLLEDHLATNDPATSEQQPVDSNSMGQQKTDSVSTPKTDTVSGRIAAAETKSQHTTPVQNTKVPPKKNTGKWSIGITAFAGKSNTVQKLFGSSKTDPSANYINDTLAPGTTHPDKPFTPSGSYEAGIFVQRKISEKNSITVGINYLHFSNKAEVTNSNSPFILAVAGPAGVEYVNNYYTPAASEEKMRVTNKYNFISLGTQFHHLVINSKKTPLYASGGLSALRLLSANTLIYDNKTNTYYHKDDWLSKWQGSFNAGVSLHINLNHNNYLFVGPQMSYGFTNLLNNKNYLPQHLINYGVQAGWAIGKK